MRHRGVYRNAAARLALTVMVAALAAALIRTPLAALRGAHAQGAPSADVTDLFAPFWEAWNLLHENYVDPLDDTALAQGAIGGLVAAGQEWLPALQAPAVPADAATIDARFTPFWQTWDVLHQSGSSVDDTALMEGALSGMIRAIGDPHTDYMPPTLYATINESMNGEYEGIGATVKQDEATGGLELVTIMDGSPAQAAGLRPGDLIVEVAGVNITHLTQSEIIARVRGPAGSTVHLGIQRGGAAALLQFDVLRQRIVVPSVVSKLLPDNIGYVRLSQFEANTGPDMRAALETLHANDLKGLVLDLRGNPGGYLTTSIDVASAYIADGAVLIERSPTREQTHEVLGDAIAPDVPMVVLVDQGSASASELIAGALQDHHRATIVGVTTFGKGSVQTWRELSNGGGIRITISRWYTPDGHSVSEVGIHPDVVVPYEPSSDRASADADNQLSAAVEVLEGTYPASALSLEAPAQAPAVN